VGIDMIDKSLLLSELYKWKIKGYKKLRNGTELIGKLDPVNMPDYWFHAIYAPLAQEEIDAFEKEIGILFPEAYKSLLQQFNGLRIFGLGLYIFGQQRLMKGMTYEEQTNQPMDLYTERRYLEGDIPDDLFYFARNDNNFLFFLTSDGQVLEVNEKGYLISKWSNVNEWLKEQISKLSDVYQI
jgi:hypothetical protein